MVGCIEEYQMVTSTNDWLHGLVTVTQKGDEFVGAIRAQYHVGVDSSNCLIQNWGRLWLERRSPGSGRLCRG